MAAWYGYGNKATFDEDEVKGQPAITMKTQGVNEVVRPTTTAARYVVGGGYKGRSSLRDTIDKLGKVKAFLDHDDREMIVPTNLSRPGPNMATRPSWPKVSYFGQMKKKEDDEKGPPGFNNQESFTPADKAEDSSKKPNNFWQDQDDREVDSIAANSVMKPTNYRGTAAAMDSPYRDDRQSYVVNNNSSDEDNSSKVKESEEMPNFPNRNGHHNNSESNPYEDYKTKHEKPNMSNGGDIKKEQNMENTGFNNSKTSATQDSAAPMHRTGDLPNTNWQHKDDDGQKKNNIAPRTYVKPNISNGWQDYYHNGPLQRNVNYPQGGYRYNTAQRWKEITPNPPPQQLQYGGGGDGVYPYFRPVYRRAVIDSKRAEKKYNGLLLNDN